MLNNILYALSAVYLLIMISILINNKYKDIFIKIINISTNKESILLMFDSFRGILALWVILFHIWQWNMIESLNNFIVINGNIAVPVFIFISGFFIYLTLHNKELNQYNLYNYYVKRFYRIVPLYTFTVIFMAIFSEYYIDNNIDFNKYFLSELLMFRAFGYDYFFNPPAWSLYVEVMFYLMLPLIILLHRRLSLFIYIFLIISISYELFNNTNSISREFELLKFLIFGIIVADLYIAYRKNIEKINQFFIILSLPIILYLTYLDLQYNENNYYSFTHILIFSFLMFSMLYNKFLNRLFTNIYFIYLGKISFSMYMIHSFVITTGNSVLFNGKGGLINLEIVHYNLIQVFFLYILPILFFSTLTYIYIELPFLRKKLKYQYQGKE